MPEIDLKGKTIMVTAGPTRERIDPVRYISNFSSGKMGYAIAQRALERGARVYLISGPTALEPPNGVSFIKIEGTLDLLDAAIKTAPLCDIVIQAAAPADYRPEAIAPAKIKKSGDDMVIKLVENPDTAATIGKNKRQNQVFVVFAAETNVDYNAAVSKMTRKNADFLVFNDITKKGAGFDADTNIAAIVSDSGVQELPVMLKTELADIILTKAAFICDSRSHN